MNSSQVKWYQLQVGRRLHYYYILLHVARTVKIIEETFPTDE